MPPIKQTDYSLVICLLYWEHIRDFLFEYNKVSFHEVQTPYSWKLLTKKHKSVKKLKYYIDLTTEFVIIFLVSFLRQ